MLQSSCWKFAGFEASFTKTLASYGEEETSGYVANPGNVPQRRRSSSDLGADVEIS